MSADTCLPPVIAIAGPTAVGKSAVALQLAEELGGEIVSADARQVYRELDIGTAKPTRAQMARIPHHLIDCRTPAETYSAADFLREAGDALKDITRRGRVAIVAGGTGLYLKVLREGMFEAPAITPEVRSEVDWLLQSAGLQGLLRYLEQHDPETLAVLDPRNRARLRRAVEFHLQTDRSLTKSRLKSTLPGAPFRFFAVVLVVPRPQLYKQIELRAREMLRLGWLDEVRSLLGAWSFDLPAFGAVGYRELEAVVNESLELDEAIRRIVIRTRQYAKRQLTWFTHQGQWLWMTAENQVTAKIASGFASFAENKSA